MSNRILTAVSILGAVLASVAAAGEYEKIDLLAPRGDPAAGREAFVALSCTSCHAVQGDLELKRPVASMPVPVLGPDLAKLSPGKLASAMVSPSHTISKEVQEATAGELSPMGDLTESMTVRQLVDLVAYLRSLGKAAVRPGG